MNAVLLGGLVAVGIAAQKCTSSSDCSLNGEGLVAVGIAAQKCTTSSDCSLNGECVANACVCDAAWSGSPSCDVLALLPAARYSSGYFNESRTSWGGLPIANPSGGFSLFAAEMLNGCPLLSWKSNSVVIRADATTSGGPFIKREPVDGILGPFAHNPKITQAPDGTYVIFYIGFWNSTTIGAPPNCPSGVDDTIGGADDFCWPYGDDARRNSSSPITVRGGPYPGVNADCCGPQVGLTNPLNGGCGLAIASSKSLDGPWVTSPLYIENQFDSALLDCTHTNPAPVYLPNGTVIVAINAGFCHGGLETIALISAPSWNGTYNLLTLDPILTNADGSPHACEDPTLWTSARGFHMMVHNQDGAGIARYAHSVDAFNWTLHDGPGPYDGDITWSDANATLGVDLQRPQIVFDPSGKPEWLINGMDFHNNSLQHTLFRPIKQ